MKGIFVLTALVLLLAGFVTSQITECQYCPDAKDCIGTCPEGQVCTETVPGQLCECVPEIQTPEFATGAIAGLIVLGGSASAYRLARKSN